jgi:hypothetical protein
MNMNTVSRIKSIPAHGLLASALLALGLALAPTVSMADKDGHHDNGRIERDAGSHHNRGHERGHEGKHGRAHSHTGRYEVHKPIVREEYVYHVPAHERSSQTIIYNYPVRTHTHTYIETPEYDRLRLLLGLHLNNIDVIFRD